MPTAKRKPRRRWGNWELFTSNPPTLGYRVESRGGIYHVPIKECQTQEGLNRWVNHLTKTKVGWDVASFIRAIEELRAEGNI